MVNNSEFSFLFKDLVFEKFTLLAQVENLSTQFYKKKFLFNSLFPLIFTKIANAPAQVCKRLKFNRSSSALAFFSGTSPMLKFLSS
jgi:hypothetical protein